jgi:NAD(P)H-dependent flavin oxidoreductase YrpB (nitropropane dioxygenase family)
LVAAVSNASGLGTLGAVFTSADSLASQLVHVREPTDRSIAINHVVPLLDEEVFALTRWERPAVFSLARGDPGDLVARAQVTEARGLHQVHTVRQARQVVERGVDVIVAQGSEAGGQGPAEGAGTLALVTHYRTACCMRWGRCRVTDRLA